MLAAGDVCYDLDGNELFSIAGEGRRFCGGFSDGLIASLSDEEAHTLPARVGFHSKSGELLFVTSRVWAPPLAASFAFSDGRFCVPNEEGRWGFIDTGGEVVIPCVYDEPAEFSEGLANVRLNGEYLCIDVDGNVVFRLDFGFPFYVGPFAEEVAPVYRLPAEGPYEYYVGFMDKSGKLVVDCLYPSFYSAFSPVVPPYAHQSKSGVMANGLIGVFGVEGDRGWIGYIDAQGNVVYRSGG